MLYNIHRKKVVSVSGRKKKTAQLFDKIFKELMTLSAPTIIRFINALFGRDHPLDSTIEYINVETVSEELKKRIADIIIRIGGEFTYHIEAQIGDDDQISIRLFEYGYNAALKYRRTVDGVIELPFPESRVIYWESTENTPDVVTLRFKLPNGENFDYEVKTFKLLDHSIEELSEKNLTLLLPFYVLKLRNKVENAKSSGKRRELPAELTELLNELLNTIEQCAGRKELNYTDLLNIELMLGIITKELYGQYAELEDAMELVVNGKTYKRAEVMIAEAEKRGREIAQEQITRTAVIGFKREKTPDEVIARALSLPLEQVREIHA
jgi:hypothetical protein